MSTKILLHSAFFDLTNPGGGAIFSMDIVYEWLQQGREIHVVSARRECRDIGRLQPFLDAGKLYIHEIIETKSLSHPHALCALTSAKMRNLLSRTHFDSAHVHNFHGLLSAVLETVNYGVPTTYVPLDFGMTCFNFYRFDGTTRPCDGPERKKCRICLIRFERMGVSDLPHHTLGILKRLVGIREGGHRKYFDLAYRNYLKTAPDNLPVMLELLKKFDRIITPSPPVFESMKLAGIAANKLYSATYPVSPLKTSKSFPLVTRPTGSLRLLYLGNSHIVKGWPILLQVLKALPDGLDLEIFDAGGNLRPSDAKNPRITRYLKTSVRYPTDKVVDLFATTDAVLVPSIWHENTPLVVLESLANHRPVIAADQAGIRHLVHSGFNGILLPAGDVTAWKNELCRLAERPELIREMRKNCQYRKSVAEYLKEIEGT